MQRECYVLSRAQRALRWREHNAHREVRIMGLVVDLLDEKRNAAEVMWLRTDRGKENVELWACMKLVRTLLNFSSTNLLEHRIYIVTCWLVTRQIICGFWILCSIYWLYRQTEFTINYNTLNLTTVLTTVLLHTALSLFYKRWSLTFGERSVVYYCAWRHLGQVVFPYSCAI
jgi:hypothetical protein